jgi:hypothetical protein
MTHLMTIDRSEMSGEELTDETRMPFGGLSPSASCYMYASLHSIDLSAILVAELRNPLVMPTQSEL